MSLESLPNDQRGKFVEGEMFQQFMQAEVAVLSQLFGENDEKWADWLNAETAHGERLRALVTGCYSDEQHSFSENCVSSIVTTLRKDIEATEQFLH
jgi:hypothetical protein